MDSKILAIVLLGSCFVLDAISASKYLNLLHQDLEEVNISKRIFISLKNLIRDGFILAPCVGEEGFCNWDDKKCCAMNSSKKRLRCNQYHHSGKCQVNQWQPERKHILCINCEASYTTRNIYSLILKLKIQGSNLNCICHSLP